MFQVNDAIIYGVHGVCKIRGTEDRTVGGTTRTYLVLQPESDKGAAFFVPTDNPHVLEKIRRLLTKDQIHRLIDAMPENDGVWVEDENARRELYGADSDAQGNLRPQKGVGIDPKAVTYFR